MAAEERPPGEAADEGHEPGRPESDSKTPPLPPRFDPVLDCSPFTLLHQLRLGTAPRLVDLRPADARPPLSGAIRPPSTDWRPSAGKPVVLVDDDGGGARRLAESWQREGLAFVRALYGGLRLWQLCFPATVVEERLLEGTADGEHDESLGG